MQIGIIGYRNHAARLRTVLQALPHVDTVVVYHPDAERLASADLGATSPSLTTTSQLRDLHGLDAVVVASPTTTHVDYVDALTDQVGHVYCEKPPAATRAELDRLGAFDEAKKRRTYFNFNYRHTELGKTAKEFLRSGEIGAPVHFSFVSTHGLAFRESFGSDWRASADQLSGIFGNVAIHYVDLCMWLLGDAEDVTVHKSAQSPHTRTADSVSTVMRFGGGCTADIFVSYAAPFINQARLVFTDGYLELDDGALRLHRPRDHYDDGGRFAPPPSEELLNAGSSRAYYDRSLRASLERFVSTASSGGSFAPEEFEQALRSNALIFDH